MDPVTVKQLIEIVAWIIGAILAVLGVLLGIVWRDLRARVERITTLAESVTALDVRVKRLEGDYQNMHTWKNATLPLQFERSNTTFHEMVKRVEAECQRRFEQLERKVFNGQR